MSIKVGQSSPYSFSIKSTLPTTPLIQVGVGTHNLTGKHISGSRKATTVVDGSVFSVKPISPPKYKVNLSCEINVTVGVGTDVATLNDLQDVEISGTNDKYVLMYDQATGKWKDVNPDLVLSASSTTETIQPGLPSNFLNELDVQLDDRIDLDAGTF